MSDNKLLVIAAVAEEGFPIEWFKANIAQVTHKGRSVPDRTPPLGMSMALERGHEWNGSGGADDGGTLVPGGRERRLRALGWAGNAGEPSQCSLISPLR
jgi:hypothetical protein